jgi:hypothetical protein
MARPSALCPIGIGQWEHTMTNYAQNVHAATGPGTVKHDAGAGNTFRTFTLRVCSPVPDSVVALETSPDNTTWTARGSVTGDGWITAASDVKIRAARANVTALGAGGAGALGNGLSSIVLCIP